MRLQIHLCGRMPLASPMQMCKVFGGMCDEALWIFARRAMASDMSPRKRRARLTRFLVKSRLIHHGSTRTALVLTSIEYCSLRFSTKACIARTPGMYVPINIPDNSPYHLSVYHREAYEDSRMPNRPDLVKQRQPIWGKPGDTPVNVDKLYGEYLQRTCACRPGF
jgi:hypothetical protein